jgi:hypothetical protein
MPKKKQNINHWLQTFGKANGYKVLKEIKDYAEYPDVDSVEIAYGKRQMLNYILDRLKAASIKKEVYASIIYEVELL